MSIVNLGQFGKGWEVQKNYIAMTAPYYHALIGIPKPGHQAPAAC